MTQKEASAYLRARISLDHTQRPVLGEYLTRTTLLWNYLHRHLKEDLNQYISSPPSKEADKQFSEAVYLWLNKLFIEGTEERGIYQEWTPFVETILGLDRDLIVNRADDYIDACLRAKDDRDGKSFKQTSGLPQFKNGNSSQSVRFSAKHFDVVNGLISINSIFPMSISVPEFAESDTHGMDLIVTRRRRAAEPKKTFGPTPEEELAYVVTLRAPEVR